MDQSHIVKFRQPDDLLGVTHDHNHSFIEWFSDDAKVVFSFARRGKPDDFALDCHIAANKKGLRHVKQAILDFSNEVKKVLPCCKMLLAVIEKPSVKRIVKKCGFVYICKFNDYEIYGLELWAG